MVIAKGTPNFLRNFIVSDPWFIANTSGRSFPNLDQRKEYRALVIPIFYGRIPGRVLYREYLLNEIAHSSVSPDPISSCWGVFHPEMSCGIESA